eukprot:284818310_4
MDSPVATRSSEFCIDNAFPTSAVVRVPETSKPTGAAACPSAVIKMSSDGMQSSKFLPSAALASSPLVSDGSGPADSSVSSPANIPSAFSGVSVLYIRLDASGGCSGSSTSNVLPLGTLKCPFGSSLLASVRSGESGCGWSCARCSRMSSRGGGGSFKIFASSPPQATIIESTRCEMTSATLCSKNVVRQPRGSGIWHPAAVSFKGCVACLGLPPVEPLSPAPPPGWDRCNSWDITTMVRRSMQSTITRQGLEIEMLSSSSRRYNTRSGTSSKMNLVKTAAGGDGTKSLTSFGKVVDGNCSCPFHLDPMPQTGLSISSCPRQPSSPLWLASGRSFTSCRNMTLTACPRQLRTAPGLSIDDTTVVISVLELSAEKAGLSFDPSKRAWISRFDQNARECRWDISGRDARISRSAPVRHQWTGCESSRREKLGGLHAIGHLDDGRWSAGRRACGLGRFGNPNYCRRRECVVNTKFRTRRYGTVHDVVRLAGTTGRECPNAVGNRFTQCGTV